MDDQPNTPDRSDLGLTAGPNEAFRRAIERVRKQRAENPELERRDRRRIENLSAWYARYSGMDPAVASRLEDLIADMRTAAESFLGTVPSRPDRLRATRTLLTEFGLTPKSKDFPLSFEHTHTAIWAHGDPSLEERADGQHLPAAGPVIKYKPPRWDALNYGEAAFAISREGILKNSVARRNEALAGVHQTGNKGGYLPALIKWATDELNELIAAQAQEYVDAFTLFNVPCDQETEQSLEEIGLQLAAGTGAKLRGELDLFDRRTKLNINDGMGTVEREIQSSMRSALSKGKLALKRQAISFRTAGADNTQSPDIASNKQNGVASLPKSSGSPQTHRFHDAHHPVFMYHATNPPVQVFSRQEIEELGPEWSEVYIHQEYPKVVHHLNAKSRTVHSREEEDSFRGGWGTIQEVEFYKDPKRARQQPGDATKWVDESHLSKLPGINSELISAAVLKADALFWREPDSPSAAVAAMQLAFRCVSQVLLGAGVLTRLLLENDLPVFVWDCAIAGGWWHLASDKPCNFCPDQIGHYWVWRDDRYDWEMLFRAEISEWTAALLAGRENPSSNRTPKGGELTLRRAQITGPSAARLTPQQQDLLQVVVREYRIREGTPFLFVKSHSGAALCYAGGQSVPVIADESDFVLLRKENLLSWTKVGKALNGKPTQHGIDLADSLNWSCPDF